MSSAYLQRIPGVEIVREIEKSTRLNAGSFSLKTPGYLYNVVSNILEVDRLIGASLNPPWIIARIEKFQILFLFFRSLKIFFANTIFEVNPASYRPDTY